MFITDKRAEKIKKILRKKQKDLQVFSDNVTNPHNFSAILRTSDAVGVLYLYYRYSREDEVINEEITMGSHKWVIHQKVPDQKLEEFFYSKKNAGFQIVATSLSKDSVHFRNIDYTKPTVIVVGHELKGVSEEILSFADHKIIIPMYGMAQSLNVSVATGVILYEAQRQREEKGMYNKPSLTEEEIDNVLKKWATEDVIKEKKSKSAIRYFLKND